jgi:hypothetical protein
VIVHQGISIDIPIGGSAEKGKGLNWNIVGDEFLNRVTDEQVRMLNVIPEILPDLLLRRSWNVNEVTANLDVRSVDDWQVRAILLDEWDETWHLGVIWGGSISEVVQERSRHSPMKAMSTPPSAKGPPSVVHLSPFLRIHASKLALASSVKRRLGSATP